MTLAYIITEGNKDIEILNKLLPKTIINDIKFADGQGQYGAFSLASSLLSTRPTPVVLVTDADKEDDSSVSEQLDSLNYLLRQSSRGTRFKVLIAVPEIEVLLLQDRALIQKLAERSFTDLEWLLAKSQPKRFLAEVFGNNTPIIEKIFTNISDQEVQILQQHKLIQDLTHFLESVVIMPKV